VDLQRMSFSGTRATDAPPFPQGRPRAATTVWGDGIQDLSLTSLWYPCAWNDVSEDELLLLIPSLSADSGRRAPAGASASRAVTVLWNAFHARLAHVVITYAVSGLGAAGAPIDETRKRMDSLRRVLDKHLEERESLETLLERAAPHHGEWLFPARRQKRKWRGWRSWCRHDEVDLEGMFELECTVLGLMATMVNAARLRFDSAESGVASSEGSEQRGRQCPTLPRATLAAIHTSFNPAYLYPQLTAHHETFAVAGWLGWLARARPALLPVYVAEPLVDLLDHVDGGSAPADAIVAYYADQVVGRESLRRRARRVLARGMALPITPRPIASGGDPRRILALVE